MAITLKQSEALPESYPVLDPAVADEVWQRLEAYVAHRWTPREVVWIVEGCGEWVAPLTPAAITTVEIWSDRIKDWETATLDASPMGGLYLRATGPYRITATVGSDVTAPANVAKAAQRLSGYMAAKAGTPGASSERVKAGSVEVEKSRSESWVALAMQNSGAADLLRYYRRA